ncbi:toxin-antitoxin system YwqK family antitoxin [Streptomyces sp. NPDC102384]|uniref:toxin-antitoxin system YwqK family antitoxin n=1 Tax=Streptomyces sp. NPDC102384 TaxID=3366166 RepID=UPI0038113C28
MRVAKEDTYEEEDALVHYEGEPFTDEVARHNQEGQLNELAIYVGGITCGPYQLWWSKGALKAEGRLRQGLHVGEWHRWHRNGQLAEHTLYGRNGVEVYSRILDAEGNLTYEYGTLPQDPSQTADINPEE